MGQHLKTIEQPFIIEVLDERFDNISTMLTNNAVVYGSSITSIISGLPANGDLDIAVSHTEFMMLCKRFANSSKWKQTGGHTIKETDFGRKEPYRGLAQRSAKNTAHYTPGHPPTHGSSNKKSYRNVSTVVTFETVGDKHVQIIQAREETNDPLSDALSIVRAVDFVFCGIAIDRHGKIFEVIRLALDDCKSRIIRVANYHSELAERFKKYTKRGWSLGISIDQANQNYLKRKENKEVKQRSNKKYTEVARSKAGNVILKFLPSALKKLTLSELHSLVVATARKDFGIYLKRINTEPIVYIEDKDRKIKGRYLSGVVAKALCEKIVFKLGLRSLLKKKKKFKHHDDYGKTSIFTVTPPANFTVNPLHADVQATSKKYGASLGEVTSGKIRGIMHNMDAAPRDKPIKPWKRPEGASNEYRAKMRTYDIWDIGRHAVWDSGQEEEKKKKNTSSYYIHDTVTKKGGSNE